MKLGLQWEEFSEGTQVTPLSLTITYDMAAGVIFATRDWFPGHHEPAYAKSQGKSDIYVNTAFLHGFIDRVALRWAGPAWYVRRRKMRILESIYPGDVLIGSGIVKSKSHTETGEPMADIVIDVRKGDVLAVTAEVGLALPARAQQLMMNEQRGV